MPDALSDFKRKWNDFKTGYKYKVWFEGQTEVKTIFIPEQSTVVYAAKRARLDRQYDRPYTVYVYTLVGSVFDREEKGGDVSSIVTLKEMATNIAEHISKGTNRSVGRRQKIRNPITYEGNRFGHYLVTTVEDTEWTKDIHGTTIARPPKHELYFQTDWDFPGLAETFGWDGKILPMTKTRAVNIKDDDQIGREIYSAIQYLDANEGKVVEDPGYWEGDD